jgi:hypothetical protein
MYNHQVPAYRHNNTKLISLRIGALFMFMLLQLFCLSNNDEYKMVQNIRTRYRDNRFTTEHILCTALFIGSDLQILPI